MHPHIKVHAFKVNRIDGEIPLETRLEAIDNKPIDARNRDVSQVALRLEELSKKGVLRLCDFVKIRTDHGPARASTKAPVIGFDLDDHEGFGEETAVLYDPKSGIALVHYNHYGPRANSIAEYLSQYDHDNPMHYEFVPKYVNDVHRHLLNKTILRNFSVAIAPRLMNQEDLKAGLAMQDALRLSDEFGADVVELTIKIEGRRKGSLAQKLKKFGAYIIRRCETTEDQVNPFRSAEITGKDGQQDPSETLDLVAQRIVDQQPVVAGIDKRFTRTSRWEALLKAWQKLKPQLTQNDATD